MMSVTYLDYYIPGEELSIECFLDLLNAGAIPGSFKDKQDYAWFIENILKLKSIRVETKLDEAGMVGILIEKMFQTQDIKPGDIDLIIFSQDLEYVRQKNLAKCLQHQQGMKNAFTVNLTGNHCANIDVALKLVSSMPQDKSWNNVLIVGVKKSNTAAERIFGTYGVLGDAAGILLMSHKPGKYHLDLIDSVAISDGTFYNVDLNTDLSVVHCRHYVKCITDLLEKNALSPDKIEKVIIQNANPLMISQCLASRGLANNKIFQDNLGKYGHLDCLDFLINLKDILDGRMVSKDAYILTFGTGYAGTYISSLLSCR